MHSRPPQVAARTVVQADRNGNIANQRNSHSSPANGPNDTLNVNAPWRMWAQAGLLLSKDNDVRQMQGLA